MGGLGIQLFIIPEFVGEEEAVGEFFTSRLYQELG